MNIQVFKLQPHGDERGSLIALEVERNIPFKIERVYYMYGTSEGVRRGYHAHRTLRQVAISVRGSCRFLLDDGEEQIDLSLDNSTQALLIEPLIWHEMFDFSEDGVLLMLADQPYQADDYIRDYDQFLRCAKYNV